MSYMYITPRTLLGIIRISQSLAKLHFRSVVEQQDVDQAMRLMDYSIRSLRSMKNQGDEGQKRRENQKQNRESSMNLIIKDIREVFIKLGQPQININQIMSQLQNLNPSRYNQKEFRKDQVLETLTHYKKLQVVYMDDEQNVVLL